MQILVPAHMRAMAIAFVYLFINLIGFGVGPLAAGVLSDALQPLLAQESLRYALVVLCQGISGPPGIYGVRARPSRAIWPLHRQSE